MRKLIVNADDFGMALPVNEAVEEAHRNGILTSASLMVAGEAFADAVERARRLPTLAVGLHLALVNSRPVLPPEQAPDLVDERGELPGNLFVAGVRCFFHPRLRQQLAAEIRAQFEAFQATGLTLDHVNAHNHFHLHPTVLGLILRIGAEYGCRAIRTPWEAGGGLASLLTAPWVALLRRRLSRAGMYTNDRVLGLRHSGAMDEARVISLLGELPEGVTEIYFHPATRSSPELDRAAPEYRREAELKALTSARVKEAVSAAGATLTTYGGSQPRS